jgi:hypothetical protein
MKRFWFFIAVFAAIMFVGCPSDTVVEAPPAEEEPTDEIEGRPVWVKNAPWETVRTDTLAASVRFSRVIDSVEALQEEIDAHNALYPENPWHLYIDTVPSIEDAPMCEIWIVDKITNALKTNPSNGEPYHLLFARSEVVTRMWAWESDAAAVNGKLYVDYPPPPEVEPPAPPTAEEIHLSHYHYVIDPAQNGKIIFQVNCVDDWVTLGYPSMEQCHTGRTTAFNFETMGTGYVRVDGYVYTEPE